MRGWAVLAGLVLASTPAAGLARPASGSAPDTYAVNPPSGAAARAPMGWGAFAINKGRSLDLTSHKLDWADDSATDNHDVAVGLGWRSDHTTAVIGYDQEDFGPKPDPRRGAVRDPVPWRSPGVVGLTVSFRR